MWDDLYAKFRVMGDAHPQIQNASVHKGQSLLDYKVNRSVCDSSNSTLTLKS